MDFSALTEDKRSSSKLMGIVND
ncbi:uncharacterized protein METZ01_LOCUS513576, partial [marine metagenome]